MHSNILSSRKKKLDIFLEYNKNIFSKVLIRFLKL